MSKSDKKKARRAALEQARRQRRDAIWNPDLPADELAEFHKVIAAMKREIGRVSKPQSFAVREFGAAPSLSHTGGSAFLPAGLPWPNSKGAPLSLVLELYPQQMPFVPKIFSDVELLQLFLELEASGDSQAREYNGGVWKLLTHKSVDGYMPRSEGLVLPMLPFSWKEVDSTPSYPDNMEAYDADIEDAFDALPNSIELGGELMGGSPFGLFVGGWPNWISGGGFDEFAFQVSGDFLEVDLGFDGVIYIGMNNGKWELIWEIG